jgi:hypothetical protein
MTSASDRETGAAPNRVEPGGSQEHSVCAVILGPEPRSGPQLTIQEVEGQTQVPQEIMVGEGASGSRRALAAALQGQAAWLWLLDGSVRPEPRALEHLLAVLGELKELPPPVLLASKVVTAGGSLDPRSLPVPEVLRRDLSVAAVRRGLLALRVAARGSLLVHRRGFETAGLPRTASALYDDRQWAGRLLKDELGLLVPSSVVVRADMGERTEARRARLELVSGLSLLLGGALESKETPWFAFRLAEQGLAAARAQTRRIRTRAAAAGRRGSHG